MKIFIFITSILLLRVCLTNDALALDRVRTGMVRGSAEIIRSSGGISRVNHGESASLDEGDSVKTGPSDNLELVLIRENYIRVCPNSHVTIVKHSPGEILICIHAGDVLARLKDVKNNPRISFRLPHGYVTVSGARGTHALFWTTPDASGSGVGFGSLEAAVTGPSGPSFVSVDQNHYITFAQDGTLRGPFANNDNIRSRINQVSLIGDAKSATSILEGSHRRSH